MAYELIETIEVGAGGAASIEFLNIDQSGVDLLVVISSRRDIANSFQTIQFNSDTAGNYSYRELLGSGSAASSSSNTGAGYIKLVQSKSDATSNTFSNSSVYISNYTSSANKSVSLDSVTENNATAAEQLLIAGLWAVGSAITSVKIGGSNLVQYSTASLFKIS